MKKFLKQFSQILGTQAALLIVTAVCSHSVQAATETNTTDPATAPVTARKSVFVDDMKSGKDPFFPKSTRRGEKEPVAVTKAAPVVKLTLKGISGPTNRRFALINNQPLAAGESAFVRIAGGQVKVYCWEIRDDSAVVSIEGDPERKELKLREGL